jgi:hypothetical protein
MNTTKPLRGIAFMIVMLAATSVGAADLFLEVDERPELTTFDGLHPVKTDIVDRAWIRTPVDWFGYTKIIPQKATSHYRYLRDGDPLKESQIEIAPAARERFESRLSAFIREQLAGSSQFQITDEPAADVATLWGALVDVHVRTEEDGSGRGEFIVVVELRDSITEDVLIRTIESYNLNLDPGDDVRNWLEVDNVAHEIAAKMRTTLDDIFAVLAEQ